MDTLPVGEAELPPQDIIAEQCVLGGMLLSTDAIANAVEILTPADFYRPAHATIFTTICDLYSRGEPADAVTVASVLFDRGEIDRVGGVTYLHDLLASVPTIANAAYYARIVADRAIRRRVVEAGVRIARMGYAAGSETDDVVNAAQAEVYAVASQRASEACLPLEAFVPSVLEEIEAIQTGGATVGVRTGLADLDRLTNGLQPGQLIIVAARPGLGKSTLGLDFARTCAIRHGMAAAIFSLEMTRSEIAMRLLSAEGRVPLHHIRTGTMTDDDWTNVMRCTGRVSGAPLFVDDTPNMTLMEIRTQARRLKQSHDLKLIVVDYLQLMSSAKRVENRQQEVSEISRGLKLLAKEIGCPLIAISQLNRSPELRADKRPQLSDLRESGSIEQDADMVILLHRDDYYDEESPRAGEADLIVAKHRNGPTATITVAAQLHLSRFVDMAIV